MERPGTMSLDSFNAPFSQRKHFGRRRRTLEQAPEVSGRFATQERPITTRKDRREVPSFRARRAMTDAINARILPMQRAPLKSPPDLFRRYPLPQQGFSGHDTAGATGDFSDHSIGSPALLLHRNT
jgi:hypothetical protein